MITNDDFKLPSEEETSKAWLTQLCYDGQMDDDEIEEFVDAVYKWKEGQVDRLKAQLKTMTADRDDCINEKNTVLDDANIKITDLQENYDSLRQEYIALQSQLDQY